MPTASTPRVIPLQAQPAVRPWPPPAAAMPPAALLRDRLERPLRDLRLSVTDRCNFRCDYCMPREAFGPQHAFLPRQAMLTFEEIERAAHIFLRLGVRKLRLTGGEPLLRRHLPDLVARLAALRTLEGTPPEIALTTNGVLLAQLARPLREAGLTRVTVSLDALDDALFRRLVDADVPVAQVLAGIDAAEAAGFAPVKVNMVVQRGLNESQIVPMARYFQHRRVALRCIEFMDVGAHNAWRLDRVVPAQAVLGELQAAFALRPLSATQPGETAQRWAHVDGLGEIGLIASVTQPFCGECNRARLATDGRLYTCLFAHQGHDLRALLRATPAMDDDALAAAVAAVWQQRSDRYSEGRSAVPLAHAREGRVEMHYIGG